MPKVWPTHHPTTQLASVKMREAVPNGLGAKQAALSIQLFGLLGSDWGQTTRAFFPVTNERSDHSSRVEVGMLCAAVLRCWAGGPAIGRGALHKRWVFGGKPRDATGLVICMPIGRNPGWEEISMGCGPECRRVKRGVSCRASLVQRLAHE